MATSEDGKSDAQSIARTYDELPYSDRAFETASPDRLAVVGLLHGLSPAPPARCSVLELGCGVGGNLLPLAEALPASRFVGIDISPRQIELGRAAAAQLGAANVELRAQDLMDFGAGEGPFDYILCHGVYSWVPPPVAERILRICKACLAPHGLATISYNALPGWRAQAAVRDVLGFGARGAGGPAEQVRAAREFLGFAARSLFEKDSPYGLSLRAAAEALAAESDTYVYHEYLEAWNAAVWFEDFAARAAGSHLRYVDEATMQDPSPLLSDEARRMLNGISDDVVRCEQVLDFLRNRTFRRDVLCHAARDVSRWPQPEALRSLRLIGVAAPVTAEANLADRSAVRFRSPRGPGISTDDPALKTALGLLHAARPRAIRFGELATEVARSAGRADAGNLARSLLGCAMAGLVDLHAYLPPFAARPGEKPRAPRAARRHAAAGAAVVNLRHQTIELDDACRAVLALADGSRTRAEIAGETQKLFEAGTLKSSAGAAPAPPETAAAVDEILQALADRWLLME